MTDIEGMFSETENEPTVRKGGVAIAPSLIKDMITEAYSDEADGYKEVNIMGEDGGDIPVDESSRKPSPAEVMGSIFNTAPPDSPVTEKPKEEPKTEPKKEEDKSPFKFTKEEVKEVVLAQIKRRGYKKTYLLYEDFEVVFSPINDEAEALLNDRVAAQLSKGERRVKIEIVEPYYDSKADRNVPGGRVETEYYINTDAGRTNTRNEMAAYLYSIDKMVLPKELDAKLEILKTYTPQLLDAIYSKAFIHFLALLGEAQRDLLNFY